MIVSAIKKRMQHLVGRLGYRIVPHARDAMSLRRVLERLPIKTVIDVGANDGRTCAEWLVAYPRAHVHAIEALDDLYRKLAQMADASDGRMTAWNYAASDEEGEVTFLEHADHPSSSSLLKGTDASHAMLPFTRNERAHHVRAVPLASLFRRHDVELEPGIFLKLDVQGAEAKVLRGCVDLLPKTVAVLTEINLAPMYEGQATLQEICALLEPVGLYFSGMLEQFHTNDGTPVYVDAVFMRRN